MQGQFQFSHLRLWLYISIGTLPAVIEWLTLTFDTSIRGILILVTKSVLTAAITAKAYVDPGTLDKDEKKDEPDPTPPDTYHSPDPFAGHPGVAPTRPPGGV